MTTTVDDIEQRLRVALDATIPTLLAGRGAADSSDLEGSDGLLPTLEPDEHAADRRSPLRRTMLTAAVLLLIAGTGGLIATQREPDNPAATTSSSTQGTATTQPADTPLQSVLDLLPGDSWVAIAVQPDARQFDAYDTAGRRVWFSYVASPDDIVLSDLDDDDTKIVRDEIVGDGVAVNCGADSADRVPCNTAEQGQPALTAEDLATAGLKVLPLLRAGNDGMLGDLVNLTSFTVDQIQAEELLARSLGDEAVSVRIVPGVVTNLPIGVPLLFAAPDGSSVVSVVDAFGLLYRVRTGEDIDVTDVLEAIPALLGLASSGSAPPTTTLPPEQPEIGASSYIHGPPQEGSDHDAPTSPSPDQKSGM